MQRCSTPALGRNHLFFCNFWGLFLFGWFFNVHLLMLASGKSCLQFLRVINLYRAGYGWDEGS